MISGKASYLYFFMNLDHPLWVTTFTTKVQSSQRLLNKKIYYEKFLLKISSRSLQASGHQVRCPVDIADTQYLHRRVDVARGHTDNARWDT